MDTRRIAMNTRLLMLAIGITMLAMSGVASAEPLRARIAAGWTKIFRASPEKRAQSLERKGQAHYAKAAALNLSQPLERGASLSLKLSRLANRYRSWQSPADYQDWQKQAARHHTYTGTRYMEEARHVLNGEEANLTDLPKRPRFQPTKLWNQMDADRDARRARSAAEKAQWEPRDYGSSAGDRAASLAVGATVGFLGGVAAGTIIRGLR